MVSDYGLYLVQCRLQRDNKMMDSVGLPNPQHNWPMLLSASHSPLQMVYNHAEQTCFLDEAFPHLNEEQHHTFLCILNVVIAGLPLTFFLQGAAGTGKMFVDTLSQC
jgi:hypothetical protein